MNSLTLPSFLPSSLPSLPSKWATALSSMLHASCFLCFYICFPSISTWIGNPCKRSYMKSDEQYWATCARLYFFCAVRSVDCFAFVRLHVVVAVDFVSLLLFFVSFVWFGFFSFQFSLHELEIRVSAVTWSRTNNTEPQEAWWDTDSFTPAVLICSSVDCFAFVRLHVDVAVNFLLLLSYSYSAILHSIVFYFIVFYSIRSFS